MKKAIDRALKTDDETTAVELSKLLHKEGTSLSVSTVLRCRRGLGWTCRGSAYCQLIRGGNKYKRLEWELENLSEAERSGSSNVVNVETHCHCACRRIGQLPRPKTKVIHAHTYIQLGRLSWLLLLAFHYWSTSQ